MFKEHVRHPRLGLPLGRKSGMRGPDLSRQGCQMTFRQKCLPRGNPAFFLLPFSDNVIVSVSEPQLELLLAAQ